MQYFCILFLITLIFITAEILCFREFSCVVITRINSARVNLRFGKFQVSNSFCILCMGICKIASTFYTHARIEVKENRSIPLYILTQCAVICIRYLKYL